MTIDNRPVEIYQIFESRQTSLTRPRLLPVVIGVLKQKVRQVFLGSYSGSAMTLIIPSGTLKSSAVIDNSTVKIFVDTKVRGVVEVDPSFYTMTSNGVYIEDGVSIEFNMLKSAGGSARMYKDGSNFILEDPRANFISSSIYGDTSAPPNNVGDLLTIIGLYGETYSVASVVNKTKLSISISGTQLEADFIARPDRIFESVVYDVERSIEIGAASKGLLNSTKVYFSCDATRNDLNGQFNVIEDFAALNDLGPFTWDNEVAFACSNILNWSSRRVGFITIPDKTQQSFLNALDILSTKEAYYLNPLTNDEAVLKSFLSHCNDMSSPENMLERVLYCSLDLKDQATRISSSTASVLLNSGQYKISDDLANFLTSEVQSGDIIQITGVDNSLPSQNLIGEYQVANVVSETEIDVVGSIKNSLYSASNGYTEHQGSVFKTTTDVSSALIGDTLEILDGDAAGIYTLSAAPVLALGVYSISLVGVSSGYFLANSSVSWKIYRPALQNTSATAITYSIKSPVMGSQEKAEYMRGKGFSFGDRRARIVFPHQFSASVSEMQDNGAITTVNRTIPGYFLANDLVGLRFSEGPQNPSTGKSLRLPLNATWVNDNFTRKQIKHMAEGGILVIHQDEATNSPTIWQQLSTDTSDIAKQEISVTESIDMFAKFLRDNIRPMMGNRNINTELITTLRQRIDSLIEAAKSNTDFGGALVGEETQLLRLEKAECIDTVFAEIDVDPLIPFNRFVVRLFI